MKKIKPKNLLQVTILCFVILLSVFVDIFHHTEIVSSSVVFHSHENQSYSSKNRLINVHDTFSHKYFYQFFADTLLVDLNLNSPQRYNPIISSNLSLSSTACHVFSYSPCMPRASPLC